MKTELFAIFDAAAERYIDPFPAPTLQVAIRGFQEACESDGHQFKKFPEDYALYHIGEFDAELGVLTGFEARKIAMASSFTDRFRDLAMAGGVPGLVSPDQLPEG